jgi:hypothetical protein
MVLTLDGLAARGYVESEAFGSTQRQPATATMHGFVTDQPDDRDLVRLTREDSLDALGELYVRYDEKVFRTRRLAPWLSRVAVRTTLTHVPLKKVPLSPSNRSDPSKSKDTRMGRSRMC